MSSLMFVMSINFNSNLFYFMFRGLTPGNIETASEDVQLAKNVKETSRDIL
jgi:hypothetical protein